MDKVAEKLKVEVTDEEVNGHIAQIAIQRGQRPEKLRETMSRDGSLEQIRLQIREDKCIAKLLESATITEISPEKAAKESKKDSKKKAKKATKKASKKDSSSVKKEAKKSKKTAKKKTKE